MPKVSSYTVAKKLSVIKWHNDHGSNLHKTSSHFSIDRKRIREWIKKEQELIANNFGDKKFCRKLSSGRPVLSEEMDDSLYEFLQRERESGLIVTNRMLSCEALKIARQLSIADFKASDHYIQRWKKRFNISMRRGTNDSQKVPSDHEESISAFLKAVKFLREKNDYTPYNIVNMDETMVRFDEPISRTNTFKGEATVRITNTGCKKRGFTVALAAHASGHKLPAFLIFKEPTGRIPPKVFSSLKIPRNVRVTCSVSGWMTRERLEEWTSRIWRKSEDDMRRLLILDQAPVHKSTLHSIEEKETDVVFIPAGCTSILQPADVVWIKPFKDGLRSQWIEFMRKREKTPSGNAKKPTRQDMITFVSYAWEAVSCDIVEKSFKSCGISNALNGTENGYYNQHLADIGNQTVTNEELAELVKDCGDVIFDSDSDESFDGFSDIDQ